MPLGIAALGAGMLLVYCGFHGFSVVDVVRAALTGAPMPAPSGPSAARPGGGRLMAPGAPGQPPPNPHNPTGGPPV